MMLFFILCALFAVALGGSKCPIRDEIYPCICINNSVGKKKFDTTVVCHGLSTFSSMDSIGSTLSEMEMDKFLLYDSFWQSGTDRFDKLPPLNFMRDFPFKEVKIVASPMAPFECAAKHECTKSSIIRFTATNTSLNEGSFITCSGNEYEISWASCFNNLEYLELSHGSLRTFKSEIFPDSMNKLRVLNLTQNKIERFDRKIFVSSLFPRLSILDLSHNSLRDTKSLFGSTPMRITYLDLSYNYIRSLFEFQNLPHLKTLNLYRNNFLYLVESEWQNIPITLRHIDLRENRIKCECSMKWVNATLNVNTMMLGSCSEPTQLVKAKLRSASRFLVQRCDDRGLIGEKRKTPK